MPCYCDSQPKDFPKVVIGVFVEHPTPFMEEFLHKMLALSYPKDKIHLYIHCGVCLEIFQDRSFRSVVIKIYISNYCALQASYHSKQIEGFVDTHGKEYASVKLIKHEENVKEWHARNMGM